MLKRFAVLALAVLATACGKMEAGDDCNQEGAGTCSTNNTALFCESGTLVAVPCRGATGCTESSSRLVCDVTRAQAGDRCLSDVEGQGQCDVSNNNRALLCKSGVWTAQACNACAVQAGNVVCAP
jgi:hypothetical protein